MAGNFDRKLQLPRIHFRVLFHAANIRHGTNGFTSLPKEGVLRIFSPWKIRRLRPGLNPPTWVPKASTLPLDHRSRRRKVTKILRKVRNHSPDDKASHPRRTESSVAPLRELQMPHNPDSGSWDLTAVFCTVKMEAAHSLGTWQPTCTASHHKIQQSSQSPLCECRI